MLWFTDASTDSTVLFVSSAQKDMKFHPWRSGKLHPPIMYNDSVPVLVTCADVGLGCGICCKGWFVKNMRIMKDMDKATKTHPIISILVFDVGILTTSFFNKYPKPYAFINIILKVPL
jgi:hypothetical protein